jgi:chromate transport protein ChrA
VRDTDRYVATVGPLAFHPEVRKAVTNRVTDVVLAQIDVEALVEQLQDAVSEQGVPPKAAELVANLEAPITSGLKQLVSGTVERVVTSRAFETVWVEGNRRVHSAVDKALTGEADGAVSLKNDQVAVDVAPIVADVRERLVGAGLGVAARIPDVHTDFVVVQSKDIGKIKTYMRVLEIMGGWLPVIALLVVAAGVYTAFNRRHALIGVASAVFVAMLVLGITLTVFRDVYLDHLPRGASPAAAGAVYDALIKFLRAGVRALGAVALITAVGAFLSGPSRIAVLLRTGCRRSIGALRDAAVSGGLRLGPIGWFVHRFKRWIGAAILVVAAIVLFTWDYPTTMVVVWTTVIVLVGFAIREFLDTGSAPAATES